MRINSNYLTKGSRVFLDDDTATIVDSQSNYFANAGLSIYNPEPEVEYTLKWDSGKEDSKVKGTSWGLRYLFDAVVYFTDSGLEIGDTVEIERSGLDPNLRGILVEVDEKAARWPYKVEALDGLSSEWFSVAELTKIHSIISRERAPQAIKVLRKTIEEKKDELKALETALEVLEYAVN